MAAKTLREGRKPAFALRGGNYALLAPKSEVAAKKAERPLTRPRITFTMMNVPRYGGEREGETRLI